MSDRPDPDDRDVLTPIKCAECDFLILGEQPVLGRYGYVHAKCLPTPATWLDHAGDCPRGEACNCAHPSLVVGQSMKWGNE